MTHTDRLSILDSLGWKCDDTSGRHQMCAERCVWIAGKIAGVDWSGWMSEVSGTVYLHTAPPIDVAFDELVKIVANGWPEKKTGPAGRSLFGDED